MTIDFSKGITNGESGDVLVTQTGNYMIVFGHGYYLLDLEFGSLMSKNMQLLRFDTPKQAIEYLQTEKNLKIERKIPEEDIYISEV